MQGRRAGMFFIIQAMVAGGTSPSTACKQGTNRRLVVAHIILIHALIPSTLVTRAACRRRTGASRSVAAKQGRPRTACRSSTMSAVG